MASQSIMADLHKAWPRTIKEPCPKLAVNRGSAHAAESISVYSLTMAGSGDHFYVSRRLQPAKLSARQIR